MGTTTRTIPVLKLTSSDSIVIPMDWTLRSNDFFFRFHIRALQSRTESTWIHLEFTNESGRNASYSAGSNRISVSGWNTSRRRAGRGGRRYYSMPTEWITVTGSVGSSRITVSSSYAPELYLIATNLSRSRHPKLAHITMSPDAPVLVSDIRLWEGASQQGQHEFRLDGREPGIIGYWKLDEGQGTRLMDSSQYGKNGTLTGGQWVNETESDLSLDCTLADVRDRRKEVNKKKAGRKAIEQDIAALTQQKELLSTNIQQQQDERTRLDNELNQQMQQSGTELAELEQEYQTWNDDLAIGGQVALDAFNKSLAEEIDSVSDRLEQKQSPYTLQSVSLDAKMLPVQKTDEEDFRVLFPPLDDRSVQAHELSSLRLNFATRQSAPVKASASVPDVRGLTEIAARRNLAVEGFQVEIFDQAVERDDEVGRVVEQVPSPEVDVELNALVRLFVGRASGSR